MKLFFSDVDNTLVKKGEEFTPEIKEAIKKVQLSGDEFVLCSGRPAINLIKLANQLRSEKIMVNYVSGFNGGTIYDLNKEEIIYQNGLNLSDVQIITSVLKKYHLDYLLYDETEILTSNLNNQWAIFESELNGIKLKLEPKLIASVKVLGLVEPALMKEKINKIKKELPNYTIVNSTPFFIEITKAGVNKGTGLMVMQKHLDVKTQDLFVFGDAMNDYEMFKVANNCICVENAVDQLKQIATEITESVEDNGVANYLNKIY